MQRLGLVSLALLVALAAAGSVQAGHPEWPQLVREFETAFQPKWPLPRRQGAARTLAASRDARAVTALLEAVDIQGRHVEQLLAEWTLEYEAWTARTDRIREQLQRKIDSARGGSISVSKEEDEWLGLTGQHRDNPQSRVERARIEELHKYVFEEEDGMSVLFESIGSLLTSLEDAPGERAKALQEFVTEAEAAEPDHRPLFMDLLASVDDPVATRVLEGFSKDLDVDTAVAALDALGRQGTRRGADILARHRDDLRWRVRAAALEGLERHGDPRAGDFDRAEAAHGSTSFYGIRTNSRHVVFVVDVSGSMGEMAGTTEKGRQRIHVARDELERAIRSLEARSADGAASFNLVLFHTDVVPYTPQAMIGVTEQTVEEAVAWIDAKAKADGFTRLYDAIEQAFGMFRSGSESRSPDAGEDTLFVVTDGMPNEGRFTDPDLILRVVKELNRTRKVRIHTIGVGPGANADFLRALAAQAGGEYVAR